MESRRLSPDCAFIAATAVACGFSLWTMSPQHYPISDIDFFTP